MPPQLQLGRGVDDQHARQVLRPAALEQQRGRLDLIGRGGLADGAPHAGADQRVQQPLQPGALPGIGKDQLAQGGPVEGAGCIEDAAAEVRGDFLKGLGAGFDHLPGGLIRIHDGDAVQVAQPVGDLRFAAADASGQADDVHRPLAPVPPAGRTVSERAHPAGPGRGHRLSGVIQVSTSPSDCGHDEPPSHSETPAMIQAQTPSQRGFSLVELMVVIAVIALLSAVALPIFGDYLTRARASELQSASASAKLAMAEWAMLNSTAKAWPANSSAIGAGAFNFTSEHVDSVTYKVATNKKVAAIVVTGEDSVEGVVMYLEGTLDGGRITWKCTAEASHQQWLPSTCKNNPAGGLVAKNTGGDD